jgi:hypothetical protein
MSTVQHEQMTKQDAMDELGCETLTQLADTLGVSLAAVSQWTDPLPASAIRRVESALYRRNRRGRRHAP